jgi:hypothetical protein
MPVRRLERAVRASVPRLAQGDTNEGEPLRDDRGHGIAVSAGLAALLDLRRGSPVTAVAPTIIGVEGMETLGGDVAGVAAAVQAAAGLPVYDVVTMIRHVHAALARTPF